MSRLLRAVLVVLLSAGVAHAQPAKPADVPTGSGRVTGSVVPSGNVQDVADAEVILYSLTQQSEPGLRQGRSDETGAFTFEGISTDPGIVYLVGTRIAGVPFGARFAFEPGSTEASVEVAVTTRTAATSELTHREFQVLLSSGCRDLRVQHVHQIENRSGAVVFVPPDARATTPAPLEVTLPPNASAIETPLGSTEGFERDGSTLRFWGPIYGTNQQIEFGYGVPSDASELSLALAQPVDRVRVFSDAAGEAVTVEGFREAGRQMLPSGLHHVVETEQLTPGIPFTLRRVAPPDTPRDTAKLSDVRIWIELDDALVEVNEAHTLANPAGLAAASTPHLCIGLPEGAQDLRFSEESLALGLSRDPSGALALHGPIPAGPSTIALRYQLPVAEERIDLERRFESDVPLLSLFIADTGLIPHTTRLHRKRSVRTQDRAYIRLEAFALRANETLALELERLSTRARLPALGSTGIVFVLALGALWFLTRPLRTPDEAIASIVPSISTERAALYAAIDALDEDLETGKLSAEDHGQMRDELRAQAIALLQRERVAEPTPTHTEPARACAACGVTATQGAQFCAQCGARLDANAAS